MDSDEDSYYSIDMSTRHHFSPPSSNDDSYTSLDTFNIDTTPDFNVGDDSLSDTLSCVESLHWELEEVVNESDTSVPPLKRSHGACDGASTDNLHILQDMNLLFDVNSTLRNERWDHKRLDWDTHVRQLLYEGTFENKCLMSVLTHGKLVRILDHLLKRSAYDSRCSNPISVEHIVAAGMRYLSGGRPKDICHIIGCSPRAAYHLVDDFIDAVNTSPELDIHLPTSS
jgi:hypothetical protein